MGALLNSETEDRHRDREGQALHGSRLERLNSLSEAQAGLELLECCGSETWARILVNRRPFTNLNDLLLKADEVWWSLKQNDWLEAFSGHPRIGEQEAARASPAESVSWSKQEQASISSAAQDTIESLAELNRQYEAKFGYIYIVCATGKSSEEMLAILQERLSNDPDEELRTAAGEQARITQLRLKKLIETLDSRLPTSDSRLQT